MPEQQIRAWDTEDYSTVSGTTDPREVAKAWNAHMAESFFEDQLEYTSNLTSPARVSQYWSLSWVRPSDLDDEAAMDLLEHPTRSDLVPVWIVLHGGPAFLPMGENAEPDSGWEKAIRVAEQDATGVTLRDFSHFPIVQETGRRIAFNIRAAQGREMRS